MKIEKLKWWKRLSFDHQLDFWEIKEKSGIAAVMAILLSLFYGRAINGHDDLGNADKTHCGKMQIFVHYNKFWQFFALFWSQNQDFMRQNSKNSDFLLLFKMRILSRKFK